jgi:uncharacterized cofD-like protein
MTHEPNPSIRTSRAVRLVSDSSARPFVGAEPDTAAGRPRIVAIGGGTGLPVVLGGLMHGLSKRRELTPDQVTALVTVTDDGGSSGRLRRELRVLPPGDIRNCLAALVDPTSPWIGLLQHRFARGECLGGHPVGNLMLAALTEMTGDIAEAVELASRMLSLRGRVLPSTREDVRLQAEFAGGRVVRGETAIAAQHRPIARLSLEHPVRPLPEAVRALINADAIVVGPGSLYTSILPNLLVDGIASTISGVKAARILVANLMTEPGETDGFALSDHLAVIRRHTGFELFDYVLVNERPLDPSLTDAYAQRGSSPVRCDRAATTMTTAHVVGRDLTADMRCGKVRHTPEDLGSAILEIVAQHAASPIGSSALSLE